MWTLGCRKAAPSSGNTFSLKAELFNQHNITDNGAGATAGYQQLGGSNPRMSSQLGFLVQVLSSMLPDGQRQHLLLPQAGRQPIRVFSGGCGIYNQGCSGADVNMAPPAPLHLFPKVSGAKPWPRVKLAVCSQRQSTTEALPKPAAACGAVSCCRTVPAPCPPPRRRLFTAGQAAVSRWDPCVLDDRPGELNCPWSGVFYQTLLQPSIIWIPQKGCGRLIFPQGF